MTTIFSSNKCIDIIILTGRFLDDNWDFKSLINIIDDECICGIKIGEDEYTFTSMGVCSIVTLDNFKDVVKSNIELEDDIAGEELLTDIYNDMAVVIVRNFVGKITASGGYDNFKGESQKKPRPGYFDFCIKLPNNIFIESSEYAEELITTLMNK